MSDRKGAASGSRALQGFDVLPPMETDVRPDPNPPAPKRTKREPGAQDRRTTKNRFQTINAFLDVTARALPPSVALVWLMLWRDVKPDGLARTSVADLARRCGLCLRTVKQALRKLKTARLLLCVVRGNARLGPSVYRVVPVVDNAER
jgi:hypothetical protein